MREWSVPGYTEVRVLGSGGFGEVVLARHDASDASVAIKYLRRDLLDDPEFAGIFRAEAAVLAALEDPNVVRLYQYVESTAGAAIVMELVDGVSLREILSQHGKTSPEAALVVLQGSLLGLAAAHQRNVVHRDYKPENVLVDAAGVSKLTDFGIAARAGDLTIPVGTLAYAPPEQFTGAPASPASDVYAATATFYECLAGRPPFAGTTVAELRDQHQSAPVPMDPVPEPLRPLIAAGMAKDLAYRPANAATFVTALREVAWPAYGQDWEDRGRSHLGEVALLLAALWPSGTGPAVQGHTVQQVHLSQGSHPARNLEQAKHLEPVKHVAHAEHLEHLGQAGPSQPAPSGPSTHPAAADGAESAGVTTAAGGGGAAAAATAGAGPAFPRPGRGGHKALYTIGIAAVIAAGAVTGIAVASIGGGGSPAASASSAPAASVAPVATSSADPTADPAPDPAADPGPSAQCVFSTNHGDCTSSDPEITLEEINNGDTSGCTFSVEVTWGDGSQQTLQYHGADDVPSIIADHTYQQSGTYSISDSPTVLSGSCSATGDDYTFTYS